jgi:hypothetical protein
MPPAGFKPEIQASKQQQTHALDCAATDIGTQKHTYVLCMCVHIYIYIHIFP